MPSSASSGTASKSREQLIAEIEKLLDEINCDDPGPLELSDWVHRGGVMTLRSALPEVHPESWPMQWLKHFGSKMPYSKYPEVGLGEPWALEYIDPEGNWKQSSVHHSRDAALAAYQKARQVVAADLNVDWKGIVWRALNLVDETQFVML